jgi:hypothetical protein
VRLPEPEEPGGQPVHLGPSQEPVTDPASNYPTYQVELLTAGKPEEVKRQLGALLYGVPRDRIVSINHAEIAGEAIYLVDEYQESAHKLALRSALFSEVPSARWRRFSGQ